MSRLLRDSDFLMVSLSDSVRSLITDNYYQWLDAEQVAQAEMISKLSQRYITSEVFSNTSVWSVSTVYKAKNLVEYTETAFDDSASYTTGNRVSYKGKIYQATASVTGLLPTDTSKWTYVCNDLDLFFVTLPKNEWSKSTTYAKNDQVWYKDKVYTATTANVNIEPTSNSGIWGTGTSYTVNAGTLPTDTTKWTKGDNRNPLIVRFLLDITRYHFERAIPARNVSDLIKEAYNGNSPDEKGGAIGWLKRVASGLDNADLPEVLESPKYGIQYGSAQTKKDNFLW